MKRVRDPLGRLPLTIKLPLAFVLLGVLAFGASGVLAARAAQSALEQQIMRDLRALSAAHAQAVDHRLALLGNRVEDFCSDGAIRADVATLIAQPLPSGEDATAETTRQALEDHLELNKLALASEFIGATAMALDGRVLARAGDTAPGGHVPRNLDALWCGPLYTRTPGSVPDDLAFVIASPVWSVSRHERIGMLAIVVDAAAFAQQARSTGALTGDERFYRVDVIDPTGHRLPLSDSASGDSAAAFAFESRRDPIEHEAPLNTSGWRVQVLADREALHAPVDALIGNFTLIGLFVLIATGIAIGVVVQFVLRPLGSLTRAARRIANGELNADLTVETNDEIGALARTLSTMVAAVRERSQRLEESVDATRKQEMLTRQQRDRLQAVIRSMHEGLFIIDSSGTVTLANPPGERLLRSLPSLPNSNEACAHSAVARSCSHCVAHWCHPDEACLVRVGERTHEISVAAMVASSGHALERVYVSRDVTERIAQTDLHAHQERMTVVGKLAAVVAHELNNPLAAIRMFGQMLESELPAESEWREYASIIRRNTETCAQTIQGLLDSSGGTQPRAEKLNVIDVLEDVCQFLAPLCRKAKVAVTLSGGIDNGDLIGDERQLRQVFINLIMNAMQAAPATGSTITVTSSGDDSTVTIDVCDTGSGIAPEHRAHLFKPFFTTKPSGMGTGLGLSTSRQIARGHGGDLALAHAEPGATTFRVTLRRAPATLRSAAPQPQPQPQSQPVLATFARLA